MTIVSLGGVEWGGAGEASRLVVRGCWFVAGPSTTNQTDSTREGPGPSRKTSNHRTDPFTPLFNTRTDPFTGRIINYRTDHFMGDSVIDLFRDKWRLIRYISSDIIKIDNETK